jgi:sec-independent protein translocase protein TatA
MSIGPWQIILIVVIVLLLFGAGKIPRLMKDFGTGINAFKKGLKESQITDADSEPEQPPKPLDSESAAAAERSAKNDEAAKS